MLLHFYEVKGYSFLWNIAQSLKQPPLFTSFFTLVFPKYFAPYISSYSSSYSTRRSQSGDIFLMVPNFQPSIHKSVKPFVYSFAFDVPTVWNALPDEILMSPSLASVRKQLKTHLYIKAYPTLVLLTPWHSLWCLAFFLSLHTEID